MDSATTFARRISRNRAEELRRFASELETTFDPVAKGDFQLAIDRACSGYGVDPTTLADLFGVSAGTISRWRNGRSMPPKYARASIVERLAAMVIAQLDDRSAVAPSR